ncbi:MULTISPECIES: hypothetical protein [unclassified Frankia]|uniref:hypothetical protein n=1 Tax=unclassified Frankia TaxID=2632575 RepID=UPI002AD55FDC|nr:MULTISPECIES: hypothetical protein [unclassified Frankia]
MRQTFVHEAALELVADADEQAPGAAVTVELCGHWEHLGSCRWPHHTAIPEHSGQSVTIRTLFACDAAEEQAVRQRITQALGRGRLDGPTGSSRWSVRAEAVAALRPAEQSLAQRLARS